MQCPRCKNGKKYGKQNYIFANCGSQFIDSYEQQGYPEAIKKECARNVRKCFRIPCIHRKTFCYSKSEEMLKASIRYSVQGSHQKKLAITQQQ